MAASGSERHSKGSITLQTTTQSINRIYRKGTTRAGMSYPSQLGVIHTSSITTRNGITRRAGFRSVRQHIESQGAITPNLQPRRRTIGNSAIRANIDSEGGIQAMSASGSERHTKGSITLQTTTQSVYRICRKGTTRAGMSYPSQLGVIHTSSITTRNGIDTVLGYMIQHINLKSAITTNLQP